MSTYGKLKPPRNLVSKDLAGEYSSELNQKCSDTFLRQDTQHHCIGIWAERSGESLNLQVLVFQQVGGKLSRQSLLTVIILFGLLFAQCLAPLSFHLQSYLNSCPHAPHPAIEEMQKEQKGFGFICRIKKKKRPFQTHLGLELLSAFSQKLNVSSLIIGSLIFFP